MKIIPIDKAVDEAVAALNRGELVMFPTETVYGAGVGAHNAEAVKKLATYKQRPWGKPYAIMVADAEMAKKYVTLNKTAENLYKNFLPGPLTVVSKSKQQTAPGVESESGTLGVRIPDYLFMRKVISKLGRAIVATSANKSYEKRPYKINDVDTSKFDLVVDAGELPHNEPSTVVDTTGDDEVVLRQGEINLKGKNEIISRSEEETRNTGKELWQKYAGYLGQRAIIFALEGPMGAGKTQLTKGIGKAMGITEEIISPTFNLELTYGQLHHIDAWRMQEGTELEELGMKGMITDKAVMVVEWAEKVTEVIRKYNEEAVVVWVKIEYLAKENERKISWGNI